MHDTDPAAGNPNGEKENDVVNLTRIYTKTGDGGTTALGDFSRTRKTDLRLHAYADVDEANSAVGTAIAMGELKPDVVALLTRVQNDLFDVGADLCTPVAAGDDSRPVLRIDPSYVTHLEQQCDAYGASLSPLRSFVLPGGTAGAALLHQARTAVRRAERAGWAALEEHGDLMSGLPVTYLNRLSDLLFILARVANAERGDVLWRPGASVAEPQP